KLEAESWRIADWISKRATAWKEREPEAQGFIAFALDSDVAWRRSYEIDELIEIGKGKKRKERFTNELSGATLVVDARLGGLRDGLLNDDADATDIRTADDGGDWRAGIGFQIRIAESEETA